MPRLYDITGMRFGNLTAVKMVSQERRSRWLFRCDCGNTLVSMAQTAKSGDLRYCRECGKRARSKSMQKHGATVGTRRTRLYDIWLAMRSRCYTPTCPRYDSYGGRGIGICDEWAEFPAFKEWAIANGYTDELTIDRIDNDGHYEPSNCRWVTKQEQAQNKQQTRWVEYKGEKMNLMQLSKRVGIGWFTLRQRLDGGLTVDEAVTHKRGCRFRSRERLHND